MSGVGACMHVSGAYVCVNLVSVCKMCMFDMYKCMQVYMCMSDMYVCVREYVVSLLEVLVCI